MFDPQIALLISGTNAQERFESVVYPAINLDARIGIKHHEDWTLQDSGLITGVNALLHAARLERDVIFASRKGIGVNIPQPPETTDFWPAMLRLLAMHQMGAE